VYDNFDEKMRRLERVAHTFDQHVAGSVTLPLAMAQAANEHTNSQLVTIQMQVDPASASTFQTVIDEYFLHSRNEVGFIHMYLQKQESRCILYEVWETEQAWIRHCQSPHAKSFAKAKIDLLIVPETLASVPVPMSFWPRG